MKQQVKLLLRGKHDYVSMPPGQEDEIITIVQGDYRHQNGRHLIRYEEKQDNPSASSKSLLKIDANCVELIKQGYGATHMLFCEGETVRTAYQTVAGGLELCIFTKKMQFDERESKILVTIEYELFMEDEKVSDSRLEIEIEKMIKNPGL